jgi:hypothetical protein
MVKKEMQEPDRDGDEFATSRPIDSLSAKAPTAAPLAEDVASGKPVWKTGDHVCFAHRPDDPFTVSRFTPDPENPMVELEGQCGLYGAHIFVAAPISLPPVTVEPLPSNVEEKQETLPPQFRSVMLDMILCVLEGRCMACSWPLSQSAERGCVQGNCSFRPGEHTPEYRSWKQRTDVLTLARKYYRGAPVQKLSNHDDVQDAAAGER